MIYREELVGSKYTNVTCKDNNKNERVEICIKKGSMTKSHYSAHCNHVLDRYYFTEFYCYFEEKPILPFHNANGYMTLYTGMLVY